MKLFKKMKDGGPESSVTGYWLIESKRFFSICLLKFEGKSREAFHTHAFDALSWVLKGKLTETHKWWHTIFQMNSSVKEHKPSLLPILTLREDLHKVDSDGTTWVLTFRGPWKNRWQEYLPETNEIIHLGPNRQIIRRETL